MKVCIDTNVLLQARAATHPFGLILDAFVFGQMQWAVSNPIIQECCEIITQRCGQLAWNTLSQLLQNLETRGVLEQIVPHYQFQIIVTDPDDNKFTDCAISAQADYVITSDHHFAPLANAGYKPQPITPEAFIERYRGVYL
jgi:putative PIN family toxin of toxin-antitoxin system